MILTQYIDVANWQKAKMYNLEEVHLFVLGFGRDQCYCYFETISNL